jgi:hypothetical protein
MGLPFIRQEHQHKAMWQAGWDNTRIMVMAYAAVHVDQYHVPACLQEP